MQMQRYPLNHANGTELVKPETERDLTPRWPEAVEPSLFSDRPSALSYPVRAARHPAHLALVALVLAAGAITKTLWTVPMLLMLELVTLGLVPRLATFRRLTDEADRERDRAEAHRVRELLLSQMLEEHRRELESLEHLVEKIRDGACGSDGDMKPWLHSYLDVDHLLASYARLAISYRASRQELLATDRLALEADIERLQREKLPSGASATVRELREKRLAIAKERARVWEQNQSRLQMMSDQLSAISNLVRLTHEQANANIDCSDISLEIDEFFRDLKDNEGTADEVAALGNQVAAVGQ